MRSMTKSVLRVAREALAAGGAALPPYGGRSLRRDYTQPQLFALVDAASHLIAGAVRCRASGRARTRPALPPPCGKS